MRPGSRFPPVLVGVDGTDLAETAARAGADEAQRRLLPLRLLRVFDWPVGGAAGPGGSPVRRAAREAAEDHLQRLRRRLAATHPGTRVEAALVDGRPADVLLAEAPDADLLVLGAHGPGPLAGVVGAVRATVIRQSPRPVLSAAAAPVLGHHGCPVVVGVDTGDPADVAELLRTAALEASTRSCDLRVVELRPGPEREEGPDLPAAVGRLQATAPGVRMRLEVTGDPAGLPARGQADGAQLLVVGRRAPAGPLSASVRAAVSQSAVPALVVPLPPAPQGATVRALAGSVARPPG
ncbi:universal stress protein [Modestobacter sp. NPDC049651]|uniref:universal stress protein n=1 Tax=unclassified Modestobacter TaxID=2643866 RepID=UPI003410EFB4